MTSLTEKELPAGVRVSKQQRFWAKVQKSDGCWIWSGHRQNGYGVLRTGPRGAQSREGAHRLAWEFHHGPIPIGMHVLHHCDNPPCVNPAHLYVGTHAQNMADMAARTACRGERRRELARLHNRRGVDHPFRKLTEAQVREIRARYALGGITQQALAVEYGVTRGNISPLLLRKTWAHV